MRFRLPAIFLAAAAFLGGLVSLAAAEGEPPVPTLPPATTGPVTLAFSPSGERAAVAESDTGTVAVVDARSGRLLARHPSGGEQPAALAVTAAGLALVAHRSGSVALLELESGRRRALLALPGEPSGVALAPDGRRAFVSLAQLDQVAVLDLPELRVVKRVPAGRRPKALALVPGGAVLLAANFQGGDVSVIDTGTLRETRRVPLTGVNLRGIAVSPDGARAFVTGQIAANTRAAAEPLDIWTNTLFTLDLRDPSRPSAEGWLDFSGAPGPDPDGVAALGPERVVLALGGSDEALLVRTRGPYLRTYDPLIERRRPAGARPRGVAVTPDGRQVWVANELDGTLSVYSAADLAPLRRVDLGAPPGRDARLEGRYLFGSARLTSGGQFTCSSCHPDGGSDGLDWEFVHVPDGLRRRNTRSLRGGITTTAPFRWTGHDARLEEFLQEEITGLLKGPRQSPPRLEALERLLAAFPAPPNPHRREDGGLTAAAERGRLLFEGKAGCGSCHAGPLQGGTGTRAWVGTTPESLSLDVPHLRGAHDSDPYLHDGRARTLEEVFSRHNPLRRHGAAHELEPAELADLLRYVREL